MAIANDKWFLNGIFSLYKFDSLKLENAKPDENVSGKCTLCPKAVVISGRVRVSSNFLKHVKVRK